ncbi:hypothetical protein [Longimicrobium sp.]|uniref:hypothetical protein n=1 Tax=Longimicrobium sp. TaxID=2029185 RepID=UPI002E338757|nr:hypothetical protein [Longimicrobium sp.]HEX6037955.1 hypothetical protein [Longimicrobium sp.]
MSRPDYALLRKYALQFAEQDAAARIPPVPVRLTEIDSTALRAWSSTWEGHHWSGYGGMDWIRIWHRLGRQEQRNFHCALWHESLLCGLLIGTVPRGHSHLTIRIIEARPQGHPLKGHVARIALSAAEVYADALALPEVRLENPAPALEHWYRGLGFTLAYREGVVRYLAMRLPSDRSL